VKNPLEELLGASSDAEKEVALPGLVPLVQLAPELRGPLRHALQLRQVMQDPVALMMPYWFEVK
jgi:hypothetical protein